MVSVISDQVDIQQVLQQAMQTRQLNRKDHLQLTSAMLSSPHMAAPDRALINRVLDYVHLGKIRLVD